MNNFIHFIMPYDSGAPHLAQRQFKIDISKKTPELWVFGDVGHYGQPAYWIRVPRHFTEQELSAALEKINDAN
jgi:hypothetical protein